MSGFANPIIGGGGALVYPAIHSPNYVAGISGWSIKKDGSAEFDDLTLRGMFQGTDFEINTDGAFFYDGAPAAGNLISSSASLPGTDSQGNAYLAGQTTYGQNGGSYFAISNQGAILNFYQAPSYAGPWTLKAVQELSSAGSTVITMQGGLAVTGGPVTATAGTPADPTLITTDSWQSVAVTGWSGTLHYKLGADGRIYFQANSLATPASGVNGSPIATISDTAYHPSSAQPINGTHTGTTNFGEHFVYNTNGTLVPAGFGTSAAVYINDSVPLDL